MSVSSSDSEDSPAIVFDLGTRHCRAGFAGDDMPRSIFPNIVGTPKLEQNAGYGADRSSYVGVEAQTRRHALSLNYPIQRGIVTDWDAMETIWHYVFSDELKTAPEEHPVFMTEAPLNPKGNREHMAEVLFEKFNVPAFYVSIGAIQALYGSGRGRGIVLSCGEGVTHALPVYYGSVLSHAIKKIELAGTDLKYSLSRMLEQRGYSFSTASSLELVQDMKETMCFCSENYEADLAKAEKTSEYQKSYELPDGQRITLDNERFRCPEALFNPSLIGSNCPSIQKLVFSCLQDCDIDLRNELITSIVLEGGSTMYGGFRERITKELSALVPKSTKVGVMASPERMFLTWIGGSITASLSTFQQLWVTKADYEENGPCHIRSKLSSLN